MTDRPILFSGPMVRALLDGRKTQTRRAVKPQPPSPVTSAYRPFIHTDPRQWQGFSDIDQLIHWYSRCPYGAPGDRLWVRETWCHADTRSGFAYCADTPPGSDQKGNGWKPSIHMPRAACRLILNVTGVRVERLHDISQADAEAEGVREPSIGPIHMVSPEACGEINRAAAPALFLWEMLWRRINGPDSWDANPWVWVVEFEVADHG